MISTVQHREKSAGMSAINNSIDDIKKKQVERKVTQPQSSC